MILLVRLLEDFKNHPVMWTLFMIVWMSVWSLLGWTLGWMVSPIVAPFFVANMLLALSSNEEMDGIKQRRQLVLGEDES